MIELQGVTKIFKRGEEEVRALEGVSFQVGEGEFLAVMGPSGSGKSTLMNILGCLDRPTSGRYLLEGQDTGQLDDDQLAFLRNKWIGFVFQTFNLLPRFSSTKNAELPLIYGAVPRSERRRKAQEALAAVGLAERLEHRPKELSGGEQQRVAIARAIVNRPRIVLADEPTGNLDSRAGDEILGIFENLNRQGVTVIVVTHNPRVAQRARRIILLQDGRMVKDEAK
ncbi:MAG: ABC transporter ATP-binding protein [candidate division NC10 bacterium]|nr:ABC transporter ATP-binding protein [candidate division NC10 bacterium]